MGTEAESSTDPHVHSEHIQAQLSQLVGHIRVAVGRVTDARFQAILETTAEVLIGLGTVYEHFDSGKEAAFTRRRRVQSDEL
jgi:hypothetical protein